ncbi:MAG: hypothetical protein LBJ87_05560 [bacterium]|jgi:hypothetical protein|nr:hypothetical protein [bacterium]
MERERKTYRAKSREDAASVMDRFLPSAPKRGQGQLPPTTRDPDQQNGRRVPPRELMRGNR